MHRWVFHGLRGAMAVCLGLATLGGCRQKPLTPVEGIPQTGTFTAAGLSAPVDLVRDAWGTPHVYGQTAADVAFVQGYVTAADRIVQMELARRSADGTLALLVGGLSSSVLTMDVQMRAQHLRPNAAAELLQLGQSSAPEDQELLSVLQRYADGVNAYIGELKTGRAQLSSELQALFSADILVPWTAEDSLLLGELLAFQLSFDLNGEINGSRLQAAAAQVFPSGDPRSGIAADLSLVAPVDATYSQPLQRLLPGAAPRAGNRPGQAAQTSAAWRTLLDQVAENVKGLGKDPMINPSLGSNNWIIGPQLSASGNTLVANDPHLMLGNPATFHQVHLVVRGGARPLDVYGVQLPGIPGVVLGMNEHIAWGATTSNLDVTDVYQETVVSCSAPSGKCVMFQGAEVPLVARTETFQVGLVGQVLNTVNATIYEVPHHGPILPRVSAGAVEPLGASELSVRFTGHTPALLVRALYGINRAATAEDARAALERDFKYGGQNWVIGDDQKNFLWTQATRLPKRAAGFAPWLILPGDGSAEWQGDLPLSVVPKSINPAQGFVVTANNDPTGVTGDNDPFFGEPELDGSPIYLGYDFDPGTRVGRITKRLRARLDEGETLTPADMASIQADAVTEWGELLAPTLLTAANDLAAEVTTPGSRPELSPVVQAASATVRGLFAPAAQALSSWSFDTPSGIDDTTGAALTTPAALVADSQAATIFAAWWQRYTQLALSDELTALGVGASFGQVSRLIVRMTRAPETLATGLSSTSDSLLFDDLTTPSVVESRALIAARALADALDLLVGRMGNDFTAWRWGQVHTLTLVFPAPVDALNIPRPSETPFGGGFARHGGIGTVDVGHHGLTFGNFSYTNGPVMRFVCELTPTGPRAQNVLPGGVVFNSASPHFRDQMELWRRNQTYPVPFTDTEVVTSAAVEVQTNAIGRTRFTR